MMSFLSIVNHDFRFMIMAHMKRAANTKRIELKLYGSISARLALMTVKFNPQITARKSRERSVSRDFLSVGMIVSIEQAKIDIISKK